MQHFFFNDCYPKDIEDYNLVSSFENTLKEFAALKKTFSAHVDGVVTVYSIHDIILNSNNFTLFDCISSLERTTRRLAFIYFNKYPLEEKMLVDDIDDLVTNDYFIHADGVNYDAINAKIVFDNNGILFTLALIDDLKKDYLTIFNNSFSENILNLYGSNANTICINTAINRFISERLDNFNKLLNVFGEDKCKYSDRFKKGFDSATAQVQEAVISHFQAALDRKGITPFCSDGDLIKDVTPTNEQDIRVYELRIFSPVAFRIYFYESDKVYLAMMEKKPEQRVQNTHISTSKSLIKEMVIIS